MKFKSIFKVVTILAIINSPFSYTLAETTAAPHEGAIDVNTHYSIPVDDVNTFAQVYAIIKSYYVESSSDTKLIKGAINGMLTNLDPHSSFLDKDDFKQLTELTQGSFSGIGIEISPNKRGTLQVVAPIEGSPAYYAGVASGDLIVKIDALPVANMSVDEAIKKMRGPVGTWVTLTVSRKEQLKPLIIKIKRANIAIKSVKYAAINPDYGYVRIANFQADTTLNLATALNNLYKQNPRLKGLVLDLRDDPGGILQSAVGVCSAFLPKNSLVVYTDGRISSAKQKFYAKFEDYALAGEDLGLDSKNRTDPLANLPIIYKSIPMVILVNNGTASAAEIVSGALQDYRRAQVIGTRTFGKGSVQTVFPLSEDTAVKLTTALYYTPLGRSIQAQGIKPNVIVQSEYSDIIDAWDINEAELDKHIDNPNGPLVSKTHDNVPVIIPPRQIKTRDELTARNKEQLKKFPKVLNQNVAVIDLASDFQLQWAVNILQGKPLPSQSTVKK